MEAHTEKQANGMETGTITAAVCLYIYIHTLGPGNSASRFGVWGGGLRAGCCRLCMD